MLLCRPILSSRLFRRLDRPRAGRVSGRASLVVTVGESASPRRPVGAGVLKLCGEAHACSAASGVRGELAPLSFGSGRLRP